LYTTIRHSTTSKTKNEILEADLATIRQQLEGKVVMSLIDTAEKARSSFKTVPIM
jgi:hypothetical protein